MVRVSKGSLGLLYKETAAGGRGWKTSKEATAEIQAKGGEIQATGGERWLEPFFLVQLLIFAV